jgi:hypothetical protein
VKAVFDIITDATDAHGRSLDAKSGGWTCRSVGRPGGAEDDGGGLRLQRLLLGTVWNQRLPPVLHELQLHC